MFGRFSPNGSLHPFPNYNTWVDCAPPNYCLFELNSDETEHENLASTHPTVLGKLLARFKELEEEYHPPKNNPPDDKAGYCSALKSQGGYVAPDWH